MADDPKDLVLEIVRRIDRKVDDVGDRLGRVELRLSVVEGHLGSIVLSEGGQNADLDRLKARVERIERRLELQP